MVEGKRPLRVLMLSWEYPPHSVGGLGKHVQDLIPALTEADVEVHLLTPRWVGGSGEETVNGEAIVYRIDPPAEQMPDFFGGAWRTNITLEQKGRDIIGASPGFDVIHAHDWLVAFAAVALKHAYKIPLIATIHATEFGRNHGWLGGQLQRAIHNVEWWLTYEAWRVICTSASMADEVRRAFNSPADKIDIIPNGVDGERFDALAGVDLQEFRARFAAPDERLVYYVGRLVVEKGVQVLVEAAPRVLGEFGNVRFVVAGTGPYLDTLKYRAWQLGVADHFNFAGFVPDIDRDCLFKVADVAVFPSLYEPFGIVALEAMAARTPLVASRVGGLAEAIEHDETGILVYPDNPESLAWGIRHTLRHPEWTRARVDNAYRKVKSTYSWTAIADRTRAVYERVCRERARTAW